MAAGFIMLQQMFHFLKYYFLYFYNSFTWSIASTIGSYIGFYRIFGGNPLIKRFEWLLGVSWEELDKAANYFQKGYSDSLIIFFARAIPIVPLSVFSALAGVIRIKLNNFTIYTFLGAIFRIFILGIIGWIMGSAYESAAKSVDNLELIGYVILAALVALGIYYLLKNRKRLKTIKK
jgi:membrane protein DedA with SNARE-associated domain